MAQGGKILDKYANMAIVQVDESAANTLTYKKLEMGTSLFDRVGIIIRKVEWYVHANLNYIVANSDSIQCAITNTNTLADIGPEYEGVLVRRTFRAWVYGTPATAQLYGEPWVDDLSALPGGGIIMLPNPLYVAVKGVSLASACTDVTAKIYFTFVELTNEDFFELMQARQTLIST